MQSPIRMMGRDDQCSFNPYVSLFFGSVSEMHFTIEYFVHLGVWQLLLEMSTGSLVMWALQISDLELQLWKILQVHLA